jgi:hypothetical protein
MYVSLEICLQLTKNINWERKKKMNGLNQRKYWIETLVKISHPVLNALANKELKKTMPVEQGSWDRKPFAHLEAISRTLVGMAPWLESGANSDWEGELRIKYADLARKAIDSATDPESPDCVNFSEGGQTIVDAAFLAHAILRAPVELWEKLDFRVKENVIASLKKTRVDKKPCFTNWLLFSAIIEAALYKMGEDWDHMRVDFAIKEFEKWYVGDGAYSDGADFHWDYYNSFVIQPMLLDILSTVGSFYSEWEAFKEPVLKAEKRYAEVLERFIAPDGSYPAMGRSITYRVGAFQALGQIALMHELPNNIEPAQVRCALTEVIKKTMEAPGTFDESGWLKIGLCGSQPNLAEGYICTGSLYLCTTGFLPLGLSPEDEFWSGEDKSWTWKKVWAGENLPADHAV